MAQKDPADMDPAEVDAAAAKLNGKQLEAWPKWSINAGQRSNG